MYTFLLHESWVRIFEAQGGVKLGEAEKIHISFFFRSENIEVSKLFKGRKLRIHKNGWRTVKGDHTLLLLKKKRNRLLHFETIRGMLELCSERTSGRGVGT